MENLYIIKEFFSRFEQDALSAECTLFYDPTRDSTQLGSSVDIFEEDFIDESSDARSNGDSFFDLRWKKKKPSMEHCTIIRHIISRKLPSLVATLYPSDISSSSSLSSPSSSSDNKIYLFNEHYVVKESDSDVEFRWHTDRDEQFSALLPVIGKANSIPSYSSMWCPLNRVNYQNGGLVVPSSISAQTQVFSLDGQTLRRQPLSDELQECPSSSLKKRKYGKRVDDESIAMPIECGKSTEMYLNLAAGSVVIFPSTVWHRSPPNKTKLSRVVYYAQYSNVIISAANILQQGNKSKEKDKTVEVAPLCFAVPCLVDAIAIT